MPQKLKTHMLPIKTMFFKYGHSFQQIAREGDVALYERTFEGRNICYELIIIKNREENVLPSGKVKPAHEVYPASDCFGISGWSLIKHTELKAMERFRELVNKRAKQKAIMSPESESPSYSN